MKHYICLGLVLMGTLCLAVRAPGADTFKASTGNAINKSGCTCSSTECCMFVDQTLKALTVTITHTDTSLPLPADDAITVRLDNCAGLPPGPTFSDGTRVQPQKCDGVPVTYTIIAGDVPGNYPVLVNLNGICYPCGHICVFNSIRNMKSDSAPSALNYPPDLFGSDAETPGPGKAGSVGALKSMEKPPYTGPLCAPGAKVTPRGNVGGFPIDIFSATTPTGATVSGSVYQGSDANLPGGGHGMLLARYTDDCGDTLTLYCIAGLLTYYYGDSCTNQYYRVGTCIEFHAHNTPEIGWSTCAGERRLVKFILDNYSEDDPKVKNHYEFDPADGHQEAGRYRADNGTWNRTGDISGYPSGDNGGPATPLPPPAP